MPELYSVYCDESCHLEHDGMPIMGLGAITCPRSRVREMNDALGEIKKKWRATSELKWGKVSPAKTEFYLEVTRFFFEQEALRFRCLAVYPKDRLEHSSFNSGSHDSFYYRMYYYLLRNVVTPEDRFNIYVDVKDTRSQPTLQKVRDVLCNNVRDFERQMIPRIQHIRAREVGLMQLTDFLLGAVAYTVRQLQTNAGKVAVAQEIAHRTGLTLMETTPPWEQKFNLFFFRPRGVTRG